MKKYNTNLYLFTPKILPEYGAFVLSFPVLDVNPSASFLAGVPLYCGAKRRLLSAIVAPKTRNYRLKDAVIPFIQAFDFGGEVQ